MAHPVPSFASPLSSLGTIGPDQVVSAINLILEQCFKLGGSDIHFEPTAGDLEIRVRADGVVVRWGTLPRAIAPNLIARLKVLADLLTYRVDIPQEGAVRPGLTPLATELRVSTFPTVHGEKAVIRMFQATEVLGELENLGFPEEVSGGLHRLLRERMGAIFLTGPSGSGKTTSIYACLQRLAQDDAGRHIVTIEDPVERVIPGITQSQARPGTEFDFARGLRSLLRQDPDIIMVGEIRDRETAATAIEAALTGHLLFTTLHAGTSCGVVSRLLDMGVEPHLLTSGLKGILNQRLLRKVCMQCHGVGCPTCGNTGYKGRFPTGELLIPDAAMRRAILNRADTDTLEATAKESTRKTIREAAEESAKAGLTTLAEIDRVLGPK